jgi:hypothetical protein
MQFKSLRRKNSDTGVIQCAWFVNEINFSLRCCHGFYKDCSDCDLHNSFPGTPHENLSYWRFRQSVGTYVAVGIAASHIADSNYQAVPLMVGTH